MKTVEDLAREAGLPAGHSPWQYQWFSLAEPLTRFHALAIEQEHKRLLAGSGEPDTHCFDDDTGKDVWSYSKEQMAAAVLRERERCAAICDDKSTKVNSKWIPADCAAAIRGMQ